MTLQIQRGYSGTTTLINGGGTIRKTTLRIEGASYNGWPARIEGAGPGNTSTIQIGSATDHAVYQANGSPAAGHASYQATTAIRFVSYQGNASPAVRHASLQGNGGLDTGYVSYQGNGSPVRRPGVLAEQIAIIERMLGAAQRQRTRPAVSRLIHPRARRHTASRSCSRAAAADGDGGSDGDGDPGSEVILLASRCSPAPASFENLQPLAPALTTRRPHRLAPAGRKTGIWTMAETAITTVVVPLADSLDPLASKRPVGPDAQRPAVTSVKYNWLVLAEFEAKPAARVPQ